MIEEIVLTRATVAEIRRKAKGKAFPIDAVTLERILTSHETLADTVEQGDWPALTDLVCEFGPIELYFVPQNEPTVFTVQRQQHSPNGEWLDHVHHESINAAATALLTHLRFHEQAYM